MADNKATALKDASESNIKLKVYYNGDTPIDSGVEEWEYNLEPLDAKHIPWLFKYYPDKSQGLCVQYVNSLAVYKEISRGLSNILDAVIVNTKQREALDKLVDHMLWGDLGHDRSMENDAITMG